VTLAAVTLALAGLLAGVAGTWSPCGFSMVDTLGPRGHAGARRRTVAACAAFALGAPLGGAITFGGLAALGALAQRGGAAIALAAAIAVGAAALDAAGVRVAPQLRRQVPESWRRVLPLPLAGLLYGVLLGLGFTTYVLSFALPALAAVSVAVAGVELGLVLGVAFGVGRALPIVVLAPLAESELGARAITAMAERPALLRGARLANALALLAVAAGLAGSDARAAGVDRVAAPATDPSADAGAVAWSVPGRGSALAQLGAITPVPGDDAALGAGRLAYRGADGTVTIVDRATGAVSTVAAPGADALAISARWLAWRAPGPDRILVADLGDPAAAPRVVAEVPAPGTLSRPALDGDGLAWAAATRRGSAIRALDLAAPGAQPLVLRRGGRGAVLSSPALHGGALLWIRTTTLRQQLLIAPARPGARSRALLRLRGVAARDGGRGHGHTGQGRRPEDRHGPVAPARYVLHATALDDGAAYVTRLRRTDGRPDVVRVPR
jgi:hypothetical protein